MFTDVERSTEQLQRLGERYATELAEHHRIVVEDVTAEGGHIVDRRSEEVFAVFERASGAVAAAIAIQQHHVSRPLRVRVGLHTGEPSLSGDGYLGIDLHRAARICAAGHGGQVLLSRATRDLAGAAARDLGAYALKGIQEPEQIYELDVPGAMRSFPPLRAAAAGRTRPRAPTPARGGLRGRAWSARALLPTRPEPERDAVSALVAALFRGAHADRDALAFLARVDRKGLEARLASYRQASITSRRSASEAQRLEHHVRLLDGLSAAREALVAVGGRDDVDADEVVESTGRVEHLLEEARTDIGDSAEPLRRTLSRGVLRSPSGEYVVLAYDSTGVLERHRFATRGEARTFHALVREAERGLRRQEALVDLGARGAGGDGAYGVGVGGGDGGGGDGGG
jgi:hypothetical protein